MKIISYNMHTYNRYGEASTPVEFCGRFRDAPHFAMFCKIESSYGRTVTGAKEVPPIINAPAVALAMWN